MTLVLGGARSGKSAVAERLAAASCTGVTYLATAIVDPADEDFVARVALHRTRRPEEWSTVESGTDLAVDLRRITGTVLVDSLGTWLAAHPDLVVDAKALVAALRERTGDSVIVSEEVGLGVHPATDIGRRFRDVLGSVNQAVAEVADDVLFVIAGRILPLDRPPSDRYPA